MCVLCSVYRYVPRQEVFLYKVTLPTTGPVCGPAFVVVFTDLGTRSLYVNIFENTFLFLVHFSRVNVHLFCCVDYTKEHVKYFFIL